MVYTSPKAGKNIKAAHMFQCEVPAKCIDRVNTIFFFSNCISYFGFLITLDNLSYKTFDKKSVDIDLFTDVANDQLLIS